MTPKEHRWVADVRIPVLVQVNEDNDIYIKADDRKTLGNYPARIWCFDCEQTYEEVYGQFCEGLYGMGEKDLAMIDQWWEDI